MRHDMVARGRRAWLAAGVAMAMGLTTAIAQTAPEGSDPVAGEAPAPGLVAPRAASAFGGRARGLPLAEGEAPPSGPPLGGFAQQGFARLVASAGLSAREGESELAHGVREARAKAEPMRGTPDDTRIFNGGAADPGEYPWQVGLLRMADLDGTRESHFVAQNCGGSIIHAQFVLTAAHCVVDENDAALPPEAIGVAYGANDLGEGELARVSSVIVHEDYAPQRYNDNDIAILKLAQPIAAGTLPVAALPVIGQDAPLPEGSATVTGWGMLEDGNWPIDLREVDVPLVDAETCNAGFAQMIVDEVGFFLYNVSKMGGIELSRAEAAYQRLGEQVRGPITANMVCAGDPRGQRDSCNGDSGGPLIVRGADGRAVQVGIVSWGYKPITNRISEVIDIPACGIPQVYGVYTNLSNYFDWIARHVREG